MAEETTTKTDAAALGGGVVAVTMTMFVEEGPYDWMGVAVCLTLFLLIVGYVAAHERNFLQSLALGAVLGIVLVPIWGLYAESHQCRWWTDSQTLNMWNEWSMGRPSFVVDKYQPSSVSDRAVVVAWLLFALIVLVTDTIWQFYRQSVIDRLDRLVERRRGSKLLKWLTGR